METSRERGARTVQSPPQLRSLGYDRKSHGTLSHLDNLAALNDHDVETLAVSTVAPMEHLESVSRISVALVLGLGCGPSSSPQRSDETGSSGSAEASTSSGETVGSTDATGSSEATAASSGTDGSTGGSTTSTGTDTGAVACDQSCAPPEFELAWRVSMMDIGSDVGTGVFNFKASVSPAGEAWISGLRFSGAGTPDDGVIVVGSEGRLRAEWIPEDLGMPSGHLDVVFGASGFAVSNPVEPQGDGTTNISRFDANGSLVCALEHDAYLGIFLAQRDGGWLGLPAPTDGGGFVRFDSRCEAPPTELGFAKMRDEDAPLILEWVDGTFVSAGNEITLSTRSSMEMRNGRMQEEWDGVSGVALGTTLAGFAADGRAVISSRDRRGANHFIAVDPGSFADEQWIADPSHGIPSALLAGRGTTWVLNVDPVTVSNFAGAQCCATPLDAVGLYAVEAAGLVGDDIIIVERVLETAEPVISRYNAVIGD